MNDDNAALLEQMRQRTDGAIRLGEPSRVIDSEVSTVDGEGGPVSAPMVTRVYADAGTRVIYDCKTGEPALTNVNLLETQVTKVGLDGKQMFQKTPPNVVVQRGTVKCLLHEDNPDREIYRLWGLGTCRKSNLPSEFMRDEHMRKCHKIAWATIERHREALEKQREIERREKHENNLVAALAGRVNESEAPVKGRKVS